VILPITHEDMSARRWPVATIAIIALCVACFVAVLAAQGGQRAAFAEAAEHAAEYWQRHPYLKLAPPLDQLVARARMRPAPDAESPPADAEALEQEQGYLDDRCAEARAAYQDSPAQRWGWVPAQPRWPTLLTHQFLHGGVMHLVFNMWFLWLCGCNLEDRWGRLVFGAFYLSAGVAAALVHELSAPASLMPMIGASGAIAGAMGAFLVSFARTRIRFFYFLVIRFGTFAAPAYVMLPLWIAQELAYGVLWGAKDGVAHWAHVGGFVYGAAFALVLRRTGLEARLDQAVERAVSVVQDERIMRAAALTTGGQAAAALALLDGVVAERPGDVDARLEMLRAAKVAVDGPREAGAYASLVRLYLEQGAVDTAYDLFEETRRVGLDGAVPSDVRVRLADRYVVLGKGDRAWALYRSVTGGGLGDAASVRAALAQAKLARGSGRAEERRELLEAILQSPFSTPELDDVVRAELGRTDA